VKAAVPPFLTLAGDTEIVTVGSTGVGVGIGVGVGVEVGLGVVVGVGV